MHDAMVEPLLVPDGEVLGVFHDGEGEADEARRNQQLLVCPATKSADLQLQLHPHECALLTMQCEILSIHHQHVVQVRIIHLSMSSSFTLSLNSCKPTNTIGLSG